MQAVLEQKLITVPVERRGPNEKIKKVGFLSTLFGCWHPRLTRPITDRTSTYQSCVKCGARREFDTEAYEHKGSFYYPAKVSIEELISI